RPTGRLRGVHCENQVRLVVIAIRDITKGEEITVDYSLTEWGENAMVSLTVTMAIVTMPDLFFPCALSLSLSLSLCVSLSFFLSLSLSRPPISAQHAADNNQAP